MAGHSSKDSGFFGNHYVRIYLLLLVLLAVSIVGPVVGGSIDQRIEIFGMSVSLGITVTLITAFGIAIWKASLVVKHFMHLSIERPIAKIFLAASVLLLALFWGGVAPDVQLHEGRMWENLAAKEAVERGIVDSEHAEDDHAAEEDHAEDAVHASLVPTHKSTDNLLPGGYNLAHAGFWTVLILVAVGTNAVAIILSLGVLILVFETLSHIPIVRRLLTPIVGIAMRLPGVSALRTRLVGTGEA
jgi:caa(3)-type oxidase subunit IV